jgi:peptide subunit release factor 1 (eRF1)
MSRSHLLGLLQELADARGEWMSVYLQPSSMKNRQTRPVLESRVEPLLLEAALTVEDDGVQREAARYGTGLAVFHNGETTIAIVPPFEVTQDEVRKGQPHVQPLRDSVAHPGRSLFVLVTWGAYVLALYEDETFVRHKKGTGHIHPPHKKGGSSQARFARRTEGQRAEFLRRVGGHIDEQMAQEPVRRIFFGGNRLILKPLTSESRFLRDHASAVAPRTLLVKRATLDTLPGAVDDAYGGVVFRGHRRAPSA